MYANKKEKKGGKNSFLTVSYLGLGVSNPAIVVMLVSSNYIIINSMMLL